MFKKFAAVVSCALLLGPAVYAEKITKTPVDLQLYGGVEGVYKMQNNYKTFLDSQDYLGAGEGAAVRDGANNRASQNVRTQAKLTMVGMAGENDFQGTKWNNLIGVAILKYNPSDPDIERDEKLDGSYGDDVTLGDVWIRYAPAVMVGIKIGTQTIAATANAVGIGYVFPGDIDGDFPFYSVAVLDEKPGISVDVHLSKDIEFGVGKIQGMGDFSQFLSLGSSAAADNTVVWFKGGFGLVDLTFGYQMIAVGGTETDSDDIVSYKHESSHTLMNLVAKFNLGDFTPFIGYQAGSGDRTSPRQWATLAGLASTLGKTMNNTLDTSDVSVSTNTVGLLYDLKDAGKIAFEYTMVNNPGWSEAGSLEVMCEYATSMHLAYEYPITENGKLTLFYLANGVKEDTKLREDIATVKEIEAIVASNVALSAYADTATGARKGLEVMQTTATASMGVSFQMSFGN